MESEEIFDYIIEQMAAGTKEDGINCIIVNSEVEEIDIETQKKLDAGMEINIGTDKMVNKLKHAYVGWEVLKRVVKHWNIK